MNYDLNFKHSAGGVDTQYIRKYSELTKVDESDLQKPIEQNLFMRLVLYKLKKRVILNNSLDVSQCIFKARCGYSGDDFIKNKISVMVSAYCRSLKKP